MKQRIVSKLALSVIAALLTLGFARPGYAVSANMYLSAPGSSVARGRTIAVAVHINSGDNKINAVQANLSYSSDKFDFISISPSSVFPAETENNGGSGVVHIGRGTFGSVKGNQLIATVTFKAKAVGKAEVNFAAGSSASQPSDGKTISISTVGALYTVTDPSTLAQNGAAHDTLPPKIAGIKVLDIGYSSLRLAWTTTEPSRSEVSYGSTTAYGISQIDNNFVTDHNLVISSEALIPATTYHYKITAKDTAGNVASSSDKTFITKGGVITVKVIGSGNQALQGATVTVDKTNSQKTDENGVVTFANLKAGNHDIAASFKDKTSKLSVATAIPQAVPQNATLQLDIKPVSTLMVVLVSAILAVIALAAFKQLKSNKAIKPTAKETTLQTKPKKRAKKTK